MSRNGSKKPAAKARKPRKTGEAPKIKVPTWTKRFRDGDEDGIEIHERSMPDGRVLTVFETRTRSVECPAWDVIINKPQVERRPEGYPVVRAYGLSTEDAAKALALCLHGCIQGVT